MSTQFSENLSFSFLIRLLVVSYFAALALGLLQGVDARLLVGLFLPGEIAHYTVRIGLLTLCGMILFDIYRRTAACALSVIVFLTSYLTLYAGGELDSFWRDLAFIGALLHIGCVGVPRTETPTEEVAEIETATYGERVAPRSTGTTRFREDLEVIRAR